MRTIPVSVVWKSTVDVEIPAHIADEDVPDEVASMQQWAAEQIESHLAEMTDWDVAGPIKEER